MKCRRIPLKKLFLWGIVLAIALFLLAGWAVAPQFAADPLPILVQRTPLRLWQDRTGALIWLERTCQGEWRIEIPLEKIPADFRKIVLGIEDKNFYRHHGVDYAAVCRAFWLNLSNCRILSGGSTISMQLAGMTLPRKRSLYRKLVQTLRARKLEQQHSKKEILEAYLNFLPFGGNLYGVETGAWYYFGRPVAELNCAEFLLLCGIPQRPNALRPDRFPAKAEKRRQILLGTLKKQAVFSEKKMRSIQFDPIHLRDFSRPSPLHNYRDPKEFLPLIRAVQKQNPVGNVKLAVDRELQLRLLALMQAQCRKLPGVQDGAAIVIDRKRAEYLVYIGTLDSHNPQAGLVDGASARRSAGSTLKPFLYAEAFSAGLLTGATVLDDAPLRCHDYAPGNSDSLFYGSVRAADALVRSLNTPAVQIAGMLGASRSLAALRKFELPPPGNGNPGLSVALGTSGAALTDLVFAYSILASGGKTVPLSFLKRTQMPCKQNFPVHQGACLMAASILKSRPLPGSFVQAAWKTGTSNNNCDAWCIGFTPEYTVGVWFGNKSGKRSPALVGLTAAAPAAAAIFDSLYREKSLPCPEKQETFFENRSLCAESGLTPGVHCKRTMNASVLKNVPLRRCERCGKNARNLLKILRPLPGVYHCSEGKNSLILALKTDRTPVKWYLDEMPLQYSGVPQAELCSGQKHTLKAVHKDGSSASVEIIVENQ